MSRKTERTIYTEVDTFSLEEANYFLLSIDPEYREYREYLGPKLGPLTEDEDFLGNIRGRNVIFLPKERVVDWQDYYLTTLLFPEREKLISFGDENSLLNQKYLRELNSKLEEDEYKRRKEKLDNKFKRRRK